MKWILNPITLKIVSLKNPCPSCIDSITIPATRITRIPAASSHTRLNKTRGTVPKDSLRLKNNCWGGKPFLDFLVDRFHLLLSIPKWPNVKNGATLLSMQQYRTLSIIMKPDRKPIFSAAPYNLFYFRAKNLTGLISLLQLRLSDQQIILPDF